MEIIQDARINRPEFRERLLPSSLVPVGREPNMVPTARCLEWSLSVATQTLRKLESSLGPGSQALQNLFIPLGVSNKM
jgi:hypothetical protein